VLGFAVPFASLSTQYAKVLGQTHFPEPNWHVLTSFHPKFVVQAPQVELL
jgi:hypothetical protein